LKTIVATARPPSKWLLPLELRTFGELASFASLSPLLAALAPSGDGHPVLVFPGMGADDLSTAALRMFLSNRGYATHGWGPGRNFAKRGVESRLTKHFLEVFKQEGRRVSLVGWSLGGVYARQLAKRFPEKVRCVITLGSPFNGGPAFTNTGLLFELLSGRSRSGVSSFLGKAVSGPTGVPTTSIYSRSDAICAWQSCCEQESELAESIEIEGSHCGLGHNPSVVYAIADRLAESEGAWTPFAKSGLRRIFYS
jgi:hypothetical protein